MRYPAVSWKSPAYMGFDLAGKVALSILQLEKKTHKCTSEIEQIYIKHLLCEGGWRKKGYFTVLKSFQIEIFFFQLDSKHE